MSVYVDHLRIVKPVPRWPYKYAAHMIADSIDELHAFAASIGMKRQWFQGNASTPHYDVTASRHKLAMARGAKRLSKHEFVAVIRRLRAQRHAAENPDGQAHQARPEAEPDAAAPSEDPPGGPHRDLPR